MIARRKQLRAQAQWDPNQNDNSWKKFARCRICGFRTCLNNYPDREVRIKRHLGVFTCGRSQCNKLVPVYLFIKKQAEKGKGAKAEADGEEIDLSDFE